MKALVCGGRKYNRRDLLFETLDKINPHEIVIGGAPGADWLAMKWAQDKERIVHIYPAKWKALGKKAGPIRNQEMLEAEQPDLVVAFSGGRGTEDMVRRADKAGINVRREK